MRVIILITLGALLLSAMPAVAQSASELLEKGIYLEETAGQVDEAIEIYRQKLPAVHFKTAYAEIVLGACLSSRDRFQEAEPLLVEGYPVIVDQLGPREPMAHDTLALIVEHYEKRGMPEKAAEYRALRTESR